MTTTTLFALASFASAFLIFLVQPMVGKRILPWFGGGPGVWTVCLMFYQTALFLGYAYAHTLVRWLSPRAQLLTHAGVFTGVALLLPVLPGDHWRPGGLDTPEGSILQMLVANVALPFLVLAATGPLVQAWFARRHPDRSPYPLYAVSNAGSLLALCVYPFAIEPRLALSATSTLWSFAFVACGVAVLSCGNLARAKASAQPVAAANDPARHASLSGPLVVALWLLLPAAAVIVLMAITNRLCLDLASVPFLWVLPLGVYLATFILCFGSERAYRRVPFVLLMLAAFGLDVANLRVLQSVYAQIALYSVLLFGVCMVMHGELYRLRPAPQKLTSFYLSVSGGGALGGMFVGVVSSRIFDQYHEFPIGLGCAGALLLVACGLDPRSVLHFGAPRWRWALAGPAAVLVLGVIALGAVGENEEVVHAERNFFGILRIAEQDFSDPGAARRVLLHGSTQHGVQYQHPQRRRAPTNYYGQASGIGVALRSRKPGIQTHVGVVGLGAGTLAAYGRPGDRFRFYELDPDVIRLARNEKFFTFLSDSAAQIEVVPGDARLSLRSELDSGAGQEFDVLVLDAFSSDAIPVHLLTVEAFALFAEHVREGGLIVVHISNRHLDLAPLVARLGTSVGMQAVLASNRNMGRIMTHASKWVLMSRDPERLAAVSQYSVGYVKSLGAERVIRFEEIADDELAQAPLWTDDYSDLYGVLKPLGAPKRKPDSAPPGPKRSRQARARKAQS